MASQFFCTLGVLFTIILYTSIQFISLTGVLKSPILTYKSTYNEILVSWSPVSSDGAYGPVSYNVTVMPSHGMVMRVNDTAYNITGLCYNTTYIITVYATDSVCNGKPATVTVKILPGSYMVYKCTLIFVCIYVLTCFMHVHMVGYIW